MQRFVGDSKDIISIGDPGSISTTDISNSLVTDDLLPNGDGRIKPSEGIDTGANVVDYGDIVSSLGGIFNPSSQSSLVGAFQDGVNNNNAPFLAASDLEFLRGAIVDT